MPFLSEALKFVFDNPLGKAAAAGVFLLGLVASFAYQQRNIGAATERATIQEKAHDNVRKADAVRARVRDPAARGVRDPYARD